MNVMQRNRVTVLGSGPRTLVFAHGYGCDQSMWRAVASAFESEYKIVLFDHVGAGSSDPAAFDRVRYSTLNGYASDLLELLQELGLSDVSFVGHSASAMIGALASIRRPELFASLIMIGASPCYLNDGEYRGGFERQDIDELLELLTSNYLGWSGSMAPVIMGNLEYPELAQELETSFCRTNPLIAQHFARVIFLSDTRAELPRITTRTLVLQSQKDIIVPVGVGEYVHRSIHGSEFVVMQATGHCPHLSAPGEVIRGIQRFL